MRYDAAADRLIGGDFFREVSGRWTLSLILSVRRGTLIYTTVGELSAAYRAAHNVDLGDVPFSLPLALMELTEFPLTVNGRTEVLSTDKLFERPELAAAPPEYRQLGQLITVVPSTDTLADGALPSDDVIDAFVRQLFLTLTCGHGAARLSFSNRHGSCVTPAALTPHGQFLDLYWITRASEAYQALDQFQHHDVSNALKVVMWLADRLRRPANDLLVAAAEAYDATRNLRDKCHAAVRTMHGAGSSDAVSQLATTFRKGAGA